MESMSNVEFLYREEFIKPSYTALFQKATKTPFKGAGLQQPWNLSSNPYSY
jgi:hypothetical protein